jgi:HD-like signal output (HDOD) protein
MPDAGTIVRNMKQMKTLPGIAIRLIRMISDGSKSLQDFEEIIKLDPILVLQVLKTVNSSFYGLDTKVDTIREALAFIGMDNLRNMVVMDVVKNILKEGQNNEPWFSRTGLWLHCAATGICAQMISERIFGIKGETCFLCGLIHDIGMIIEDQVVPELFMEACKIHSQGKNQIDECERIAIGTDHACIGFQITGDWNLSDEIQMAVRDHHKNIPEVKPETLTGIIKLAEYLSYRLGYMPLPDMQIILPESLINHLHASIQDYKTIIADLPEELQKANSIFLLDQE